MYNARYGYMSYINGNCSCYYYYSKVQYSIILSIFYMYVCTLCTAVLRSQRNDNNVAYALCVFVTKMANNVCILYTCIKAGW